MLARVYEVTLQALKAAHNERLWFSTLCKKARLFIMSKDWAGLEPLVEELHEYEWNERWVPCAIVMRLVTRAVCLWVKQCVSLARRRGRCVQG